MPAIEEFTISQCKDLLRTLEESWVRRNPAGTPDIDEAWQAISRNVGTADCHEAQREKLTAVAKDVAALFCRLDVSGAFQADEHLHMRMHRVMEVIGFSTWAVLSLHRIQQSIRGGSNGGSSLEASLYTFSSMTGCNNDEDISTYQKLLLHLSMQAQINGYRRYMGGVYKARLVNGNNTHSWLKVHDMKEFVYTFTRKEVFYSQWKWLTERPHHGGAAIVYLSDCEEEQFPRLVKDRLAFSFPNGIYLAGEDKWVPYGGDETVDSNLCCAKYHDADFPQRFAGHHPEDPEHFWDTPTPAFDTILSSQNLPDEVCRWLCVFLGRLLYPVGQLDNWQVIPYIKGVSGAGKSTVLNNVAASFYDKEDVGVLSNNCEKQFGISAFYQKILFCAPEIKNDLKLDQTEFQSLVAGENIQIWADEILIQVAVKNKTAESVQWKVPGIMGGNNVPGWEDQQGSIIRRIVLWRFDIPVERADTQMPEKLQKELPALILKCNKAYRQQVQRVGDRSIWDNGVLPTYFHKTKEEMAETVNSMRGFLASDVVTYGADFYCPLPDIRAAWKKWMTERNIPLPRWHTDLYTGPLHMKRCRIDTTPRVYPRQGHSSRRKGQFVVGLDLTANVQDDDPDEENQDPNFD